MIISFNYSFQDVILTSGASHALDLCIGALCSPGSNILVPVPGFPLYETLATVYDVKVKHYNLLAETGWQIDLDQLESLIDERTAAIVYNNPSNPCGSVFDEKHIRSLLCIAEKHRIPIIADEIYEDVVFNAKELLKGDKFRHLQSCNDDPQFIPIAALSSRVPILSTGGTTKKYLIPGWRMGWILIHDRYPESGNADEAVDELGVENKPSNGILTAGGVRQGLLNMAMRLMGPNSLVQAALPSILTDNKPEFYEQTVQVFKVIL